VKRPEIYLEPKARALRVIELLEKEHSDAKIALNYTDSLELLVATILSAQCTDERVNRVTKALFKKYTKAEDYANADLEELEQDIKSTGFYRNKAKNIKKCCQLLVEKYNSQVPRTMEELLELPGVARKPPTLSYLTRSGLSRV
jgi:endonuclease-3